VLTVERPAAPATRKASDVIVLIPAYNPSPALIDIVAELAGGQSLDMIVVDDGSTQAHWDIFEKLEQYPGVAVLHHAVNLGKGYALKTGINHALIQTRGRGDFLGVVTADADGQHLTADIIKVIAEFRARRKALVLGVRDFPASTPLRSRLGNSLTKLIFGIVMGIFLNDTQTGLRAIPAFMLPSLLQLRANRYDFELEMLAMSVEQRVPIVQTVISTIYIDNNASSHFRPLIDSAKIYFVFFRFIMSSLTTSAFEYLAFSIFFLNLNSLAESQMISRTFAIFVSYFLSKKFVFHSKKRVISSFVLFSLLVCTFGFFSYYLINLMIAHLNVGVYSAKLMSELILYTPNFIIQRFLFADENHDE
jgi:glycosyltransferase involved in cell wall biosynthesis